MKSSQLKAKTLIFAIVSAGTGALIAWLMVSRIEGPTPLEVENSQATNIELIQAVLTPTPDYITDQSNNPVQGVTCVTDPNQSQSPDFCP